VINGIEMRPLRDFFGMENCNQATKTALIDFGYYLAIGMRMGFYFGNINCCVSVPFLYLPLQVLRDIADAPFVKIYMNC
jgi:hypothetical protein